MLCCWQCKLRLSQYSSSKSAWQHGYSKAAGWKLTVFGSGPLSQLFVISMKGHARTSASTFACVSLLSIVDLPVRAIAGEDICG